MYPDGRGAWLLVGLMVIVVGFGLMCFLLQGDAPDETPDVDEYGEGGGL